MFNHPAFQAGKRGKIPDKMITEIFTGHAVDLHDVRAISGVMRESKLGTSFCYSNVNYG